MRYKVEGADSESGREKFFVIEAVDESAAEQLAQSRGMLISSIYEVPADPTDDPLEQLAAATATIPRPKTVPQPAPTISYHTRLPPAPIAVPLPNYAGLKFAAVAFHVLAILSYLGGGLVLLVAAQAAASAFRFGVTGAAIVSMLMGLFVSLWPFAVGVTFHAAGSMCDAVRDMARNSFKH